MCWNFCPYWAHFPGYHKRSFIQSLLSTNRKPSASRFNFTWRYIDDVLSINNIEFDNYLGQMYPVELDIKDTTESNTSFTFVDREGRSTSYFHLWQTLRFNVHITKFQFLRSNISTRYARACSWYECFILKATRLSNKLLEQGYVKKRLKSSLKKFYCRYGYLIKQHEVPLSRMLNDILQPDQTQWQLSTDQTSYQSVTFIPNSTFYRLKRGFNRTFATGVACWQGTLTPPDTRSRPIWDLHMFYLLNPFPEIVVIFSGLFTSNIPRYFLDFALSSIYPCINTYSFLYIWIHLVSKGTFRQSLFYF